MCREASLHRFLSLGPQPLANAFLRNAEEASGEGRFPLDLYFRLNIVMLTDGGAPSGVAPS